MKRNLILTVDTAEAREWIVGNISDSQLIRSSLWPFWLEPVLWVYELREKRLKSLFEELRKRADQTPFVKTIIFRVNSPQWFQSVSTLKGFLIHLQEDEKNWRCSVPVKRAYDLARSSRS